MDYKQIQELLKLVSKSNVSELTVKDGDFEICIKQNAGEAQYVAAPMQNSIATPQIAATAQIPTAVAPAETPVSVASTSDNTVTIKSPMIGTFYRSSAPDKPPFVGVGDEIKPGQILCIVEAMKLFNEIESEISGRIVKVLIDDATPVEYDQPLFLVEPI